MSGAFTAMQKQALQFALEEQMVSSVMEMRN